MWTFKKLILEVEFLNPKTHAVFFALFMEYKLWFDSTAKVC